MSYAFLRALRRSSEFSLEDWRYLTIAIFELGHARLRHVYQPTRKILADLRSDSPRRMANKKPGDCDLARLSWAIGVAGRRVPWRSDCLLQAMAADRWLRRHQLVPDFHLGVSKESEGALTAHAWLQLGDSVITGGECSSYTELFND